MSLRPILGFIGSRTEWLEYYKLTSTSQTLGDYQPEVLMPISSLPPTRAQPYSTLPAWAIGPRSLSRNRRAPCGGPIHPPVSHPPSTPVTLDCTPPIPSKTENMQALMRACAQPIPCPARLSRRKTSSDAGRMMTERSERDPSGSDCFPGYTAKPERRRYLPNVEKSRHGGFAP